MSAELLTAEQVAEKLHKPSAQWVVRAANRGEIGYVQVGRDKRFTQADVDEYIAANHKRPETTPAETWGRVTRGTRAS